MPWSELGLGFDYDEVLDAYLQWRESQRQVIANKVISKCG